MRSTAVGAFIALVVILFTSAYFVIAQNHWQLLPTAIVALVGLVGIGSALRFPRYAALYAAIDVALLSMIGPSLRKLQLFGVSPDLGETGVKLLFDGPSAYFVAGTIVPLLIYQAVVEILHRPEGQSWPAILKFKRIATVGGNSPIASHSPSATLQSLSIGGNNSGPIAINSTITYNNAEPTVDDDLQRADDHRKAGRSRSAQQVLLKYLHSSYTLTAPQKARLHALLAFNDDGSIEGVRLDYLRVAAETEPDAFKKRLRLAQVSLWELKYATALEQANELRKERPLDPDVAYVTIVADQSETETLALRQHLPAAIRSSPAVLQAAFLRESSKKNISAAYDIAREGRKLYPDDLSWCEFVSQVNVSRLEARYGQEEPPAELDASEDEAADEAATLVTMVLRLLGHELTDEHKASLLTLRGLARFFSKTRARSCYELG